MKTWFQYLKQGLSSTAPADPIASAGNSAGVKTNLKNLYPYFKRHWRIRRFDFDTAGFGVRVSTASDHALRG